MHRPSRRFVTWMGPCVEASSFELRRQRQRGIEGVEAGANPAQGPVAESGNALIHGAESEVENDTCLADGNCPEESRFPTLRKYSRNWTTLA
jgi:hypothetical protein